MLIEINVLLQQHGSFFVRNGDHPPWLSLQEPCQQKTLHQACVLWMWDPVDLDLPFGSSYSGSEAPPSCRRSGTSLGLVSERKRNREKRENDNERSILILWCNWGENQLGLVIPVWMKVLELVLRFSRGSVPRINSLSELYKHILKREALNINPSHLKKPRSYMLIAVVMYMFINSAELLLIIH